MFLPLGCPKMIKSEVDKYLFAGFTLRYTGGLLKNGHDYFGLVWNIVVFFNFNIRVFISLKGDDEIDIAIAERKLFSQILDV